MGIILPQSIEVFYGSSNKDHYISRGYLGCKNNSIITVSVLDLPPGNRTLVKIVCDYCGSATSIPYEKWYDSSINEYSKKVSCSDCSNARRNEVANLRLGGNDTYKNRDWLYNEYLVKNRSATDIGCECNVNQRTIRKYLDSFNLDSKYVDKSDIMSKEILTKLYIDECHSIIYIAKLFKVNPLTAKSALVRCGIPLRTRSEWTLHQLNSGGREVRSRKSKEMWSDPKFRKFHREQMEKVLSETDFLDNLRQRCAKNGASFEWRKKLSAGLQGISVEEWNGFLTPKRLRIRNCKTYRNWSRSVLERDDFTCQCCGARSKSGSPVYLNAHHLDSFAKNEELRYKLENGVTLCDHCHKTNYKTSFHNIYGTRNNTKDQFFEYIHSRKLINKIIESLDLNRNEISEEAIHDILLRLATTKIRTKAS